MRTIGVSELQGKPLGSAVPDLSPTIGKLRLEDFLSGRIEEVVVMLKRQMLRANLGKYGFLCKNDDASTLLDRSRGEDQTAIPRCAIKGRGF